MQFKKIFFTSLAFSTLVLTGCAELQNIGNSMKDEAVGVAKTAKDSAVTRAKMEAGAKASQATGKILGSSY
ncbi:hypothetical protein [Ursidibacter arcticus]